MVMGGFTNTIRATTPIGCQSDLILDRVQIGTSIRCFKGAMDPLEHTRCVLFIGLLEHLAARGRFLADTVISGDHE